MNIDKDIEILKELTEKCNACKFATCEQCEINWTQIQAISNVVSELESYKGKIIHLSDEEYNRVIENAQKDIKKESETWKKIAEKLALRYADYLMDYEGRTGEKNHLIPTTAEKLLDWARKEVEKDE